MGRNHTILTPAYYLLKSGHGDEEIIIAKDVSKLMKDK